MTDVGLTLAGEQVYLLSERALYWPGTSTLVVADLHWGKASTFRAAGIPVPIGTTSDDLARLDRAREQVSSEKFLDRVRRLAAPLERAADANNGRIRFGSGRGRGFR